MAECDHCSEDESMPYECKWCGGTFCGEHRLPESHDCPGLNQWDDPDGVFDSGFDDSVESGRSSGGLAAKLPIDTGPGGTLAYFRSNMTFVFLLTIWATFVLQWVVILTLGGAMHDRIFVLSNAHLLDVWTWVTSVFAHSPTSLLHIGFNSLVIYFFGPTLEKKIGSKRFSALFLGAGIIGGVGTAVVFNLMGLPLNSLGASGAALGILGVLAVLNPNLRVMLLIPPVPMSLNVLVGIVVVLSSALIVLGIPTAGGINHMAHLFGVLIGLVYGKYLSDQGVSAPNQIQMGGGPGGPGGPGGRL